ncbi:hypothetical protein RUM44_001889 [Polyplax serrata]|uniref:Uncharacterized protein n=1 Tax=Polyplax serrata TaxID=468196 RepID=A0ABR1ALC4_POLSC
MFSVKGLARKFQNGLYPFGVNSGTGQVLSPEEKRTSCGRQPKGKKPRQERSRRGMDEEESVCVRPDSGQLRSHRSSRRNKSRHDHKCSHKVRKKSLESLLEKIDHLRHKNHLLNKRISESGEPALPGEEESLSPFKMDVGVAYQHLKRENSKLRIDLEKAREENEEIKSTGDRLVEENAILRGDISLMKNLIYKLNQELGKYQTGEREPGQPVGRPEKLPKNYLDKNFLRPVVPLLKAYSEALHEKDETIKELEAQYKKFNSAFNDVLRENENLYEELEKKFLAANGTVFNEVKVLKRDLEMAKQENNLLFQQINLEKEKLVKIHSTFKVKGKVHYISSEEASKEKDNLKSDMEECKTDLLVTRGKYAVLKQEFDRLKMDNDTRIPMAVHSATVDECRKLFQELKNEYENEKCRLLGKIKELEESLTKRSKQEEKWTEERNYLEKSNFNQTFEIETLMRKISELENQLFVKDGNVALAEENSQEVTGLKKRLGEANQKVGDLSKNLMTTRRRLRKAMQFAEEIVKGQESLLVQLHEKQKENTYMTAQFGNLKTQLKDVERGAREGLNSVEDKIKSLESENHALTVQNRKLEKLLTTQEELIRKLEPVRDYTS